MKTERQLSVELGVLECLRNAGEYMIQERYLRDEVSLRVNRMSQAEFDSAVKDIDSRRRATSVETELGRKWKITDEGRAWLQEMGR